MSSIKLEPISTVKTANSVHLFTWRLVNFSKICPKNATEFPTVWSSEFSAGERNGRKLIWKSCVEGEQAHLGCYLSLCSSDWMEVTNKDKHNLADTGSENPESDSKCVECSHQIGLGNSKKKCLVGDAKIDKDDVAKFTATDSDFGWEQLISISDLYKRRAELLEDDVLRVTIKLVIRHSDNKPDVVVDHLTHYLTSSFLSKKFSDFTITCDDESFNCHKVILAARSSVFSTMFDSGLTEAVQSQVDIEDMKPAAVKAMLKFIYTGTVDLPTDCSWTELIHGAEKYDFKILKQFCFEKCLEEATQDNFGSLVLTADNYNAGSQFKESLLVYYKSNVTELMANSKFREVLFNHPSVFYEDFTKSSPSAHP